MVGEIVISHVDKRFQDPRGEMATVLSDISLRIKPGSFVSLIGPSGCGKSTLLRLIAGLEHADEGRILLDGAAIEQPGCDRGFMFQSHMLFKWMTIRENVAFGLKARGLYKEQPERVDAMINIVGLRGYEQHFPHQLSGGMCQRAALARALVSHPKVLLLDEPLGALDSFTRMNMQDEISRIWKEQSMTMVMVTHDVDEAIYMSDIIVVMTPRPGRIKQILDLSDLPRPHDRSDKAFLSYHAKVLRILDYGGKVQNPEYII